MLRTRILAAATATLLALGFAVGGASPAIAGNHDDNTNNPGNWADATIGEVCYDADFETEDSTTDPFVLGANTEGYAFSKVIVKAGSTDASVTDENTVYYQDMDGGALSTGDTFVHAEKNSISHVIVCEVPAPPGVATASIDVTGADCSVGESLNENGFEFTRSSYEVVDDGSEDGTYEVVFTAEVGYEFAGGLTELTFADALAGPDEGEGCDQEPGVATADIALTDANCFFGQLLDEEGFEFTRSSYEIVDDGSEDGTYEVVFTAEVGYEFAGGLTELTFADELAGPSEGEECVLPITDAYLAFTEATCLDPESLDVESFDYDSALAELTSVDVDGLDYTVVFTAIGENTQFFQSSEGVEGRMVSDGGTVLMLTGTLDGPNTELCPEVVEVVIPDPFIVDDCFTQSYTILAAEGVSWTRSVDGGEPVAVEFGDGQESITFDAFAFQSIVVTASADEGYTMPEQYGPFEYTFAFDEECLPTAPVTTASVSWTQPDCLGNPGSYRLTNEPGVSWTVDGVVVAGNTTYSAPAGSTPSVVASLEPASEEFPTGFGWSDPGQQTLWNLAFVAATGCDQQLTTLALTGASNALGGLGIAAIVLIMAGTGLVLTRRRDEARIES